MKHLLFALCICLGSFPSLLWAQSQDTEVENALTPEEIEQYQAEAKQLVSFMQFMFNTVGSDISTPKQKQTIITETFLKAFEDAEVQVEDDLVENRRVVTNKDVQAYLKDIDFFFKEVEFEFLVDDITYNVNQSNQFFFKVSTSRNMRGITLEGDSVNLSQERFVEINLNLEDRDLKIASVYTTKLSEQEDLKNWWNELPEEWKYFFGNEVAINDSLNMRDIMAINSTAKIGDTLLLDNQGNLLRLDEQVHSDLNYLNANLDETFAGDEAAYDTFALESPLIYAHLKKLVAKEELDFSNNPAIWDLSGVSKLSQLKRLNLANTRIDDLSPIRNLTKLEYIDAQQSRITDLSPLRYAISLKNINLQGTPMTDVSSLANFIHLEKLNLSYTGVYDLTALSGLKELKDFDCSYSAINSLSPLQGMGRLEELNCSHTEVNSVASLGEMAQLKTINIENTYINDVSAFAGAQALRLVFADSSQLQSIMPLKDLPKLRKIYCDYTRVSRRNANAFMQVRPEVLVVYESATLQTWWGSMSTPWKAVFKKFYSLSNPPSREELHKVMAIEEMDISGNRQVRDLKPLSLLMNLRVLDCSHTPINSLAPLRDLVNLEKLDCSYTRIDSLTPLKYVNNLKDLDLRHTEVKSLAGLENMGTLENLNADATPLEDIQAVSDIPHLQILYCDSSAVNDAIVDAFEGEVLIVYQTDVLYDWWLSLPKAWEDVFRQHVKTNPSPTREELHLIGALKQVALKGNREISDLSSLTQLRNLEEVAFEDTRISDLSPLSSLPKLSKISCSRSPVTNLSPLVSLKNLSVLSLENMPLEDISPLAEMPSLEELVCAGTEIRSLKAIGKLPNLRSLDVSNTNVRSLKPLVNPSLRSLVVFNTSLSSKKVDVFKRDNPDCNVVFY